MVTMDSIVLSHDFANYIFPVYRNLSINRRAKNHADEDPLSGMMLLLWDDPPWFWVKIGYFGKYFICFAINWKMPQSTSQKSRFFFFSDIYIKTLHGENVAKPETVSSTGWLRCCQNCSAVRRPSMSLGSENGVYHISCNMVWWFPSMGVPRIDGV